MSEQSKFTAMARVCRDSGDWYEVEDYATPDGYILSRDQYFAIDHLVDENKRLTDLCDRLKLEAQIHAQEARSHRATVQEIYQIVTGATGEPGDCLPGGGV